jgi:hypothetical protein
MPSLPLVQLLNRLANNKPFPWLGGMIDRFSSDFWEDWLRENNPEKYLASASDCLSILPGFGISHRSPSGKYTNVLVRCRWTPTPRHIHEQRSWTNAWERSTPVRGAAINKEEK